MLVGICYATYSYLFGFGIYRPLGDDETPQLSLRKEIEYDVDSFTRGTIKLSDWLSESVANNKGLLGDTFRKIQRVFFGVQPPASDGKNLTGQDKPK